MNTPNEPTAQPSENPKVEGKPTTEPNWKELTLMLAGAMIHMANYLRPPSGSSGHLYNIATGESIHWREDLANTLEKVPGLTVDREALHAMDLPKAKRRKFFADRAKKAAELAGEKANQPQG